MNLCANQLERVIADLDEELHPDAFGAAVEQLVDAPLAMTHSLVQGARAGADIAPQVVMAALMRRLYRDSPGRFVRWEASERYCAATMAIVEDGDERQVGVLMLGRVSKGGAVLWAARELERSTFDEADELEVIVGGLGEEIHDEELLTRLLADPRLIDSACRRLTLTWLTPHGLRHRTWERVGSAPFHRNALLTDLHPEHARELGLWRLRGYSLRQLAISAPLTVYSGRPYVHGQEQMVFVFARIDLDGGATAGLDDVCTAITALIRLLRADTPGDEPARKVAVTIVARARTCLAALGADSELLPAVASALAPLNRLKTGIAEISSLRVMVPPQPTRHESHVTPVTLSLDGTAIVVERS